MTVVVVAALAAHPALFSALPAQDNVVVLVLMKVDVQANYEFMGHALETVAVSAVKVSILLYTL